MVRLLPAEAGKNCKPCKQNAYQGTNLKILAISFPRCKIFETLLHKSAFEFTEPRHECTYVLLTRA